MPLEIWILLALAVSAGSVTLFVRRRRAGRRAAEPESGNVYPLW
jgi:hypothetical protein